MADRYLNYIGGKWVGAEKGEFFENRNPADTNDLIGLFPKSGRAAARGKRRVPVC